MVNSLVGKGTLFPETSGGFPFSDWVARRRPKDTPIHPGRIRGFPA